MMFRSRRPILQYRYLLLCLSLTLFYSGNFLFNSRVMTLLPEPSAERNLETLKVSVSYTYHETPETEECETINKRVNLATFLVYAVAESGANIEFDILFTREKPSAEKLYETLGLRAKSSAALTISRIMEGEYKNVKLSQGATERSDLCHHQRVFRRSAEKSGTKYHFVFALNDGVRGPFVDKKVAQVNKQPTELRRPALSF